MLNIKTQNILADLITVPKAKTSKMETDSKDFRQTFNSITKEEKAAKTVEKEDEVDITEEAIDETESEKEETPEEVVPFYVNQLFVDKETELSIDFDGEGSIQVSEEFNVEAIEQTIDEGVEIEEVLTDSTLTELADKMINKSESELKDFQTNLSDDVLADPESPDSTKVKPLSIVPQEPMTKETQNEPKVVSFELEPELTEVVEQLDAKIETTVDTIDVETDLNIETADPIVEPIKTDISASGQLTQMKLFQAEPQPEEPKVVKQENIVSEIETMIKTDLNTTNGTEKVTTTRIQLTPKHLGEVEIELVMKDNQLTAKIVVEQMETKQWLEQKLSELANSLADQDIEVEQFQVDVSGQQSGFLESSLNDSTFAQQQKRPLMKQSNSNQIEQEKPEVKRTKETINENGRLSIWV